jgi:hypothetical protein
MMRTNDAAFGRHRRFNTSKIFITRIVVFHSKCGCIREKPVDNPDRQLCDQSLGTR